MNNLQKLITRILHPGDWMLEKDIRDMEAEIEMMEKQLPAYKRKLHDMYSRKAKYQD